MKMLFKERFFSWFDSYDIYDETGNTLFTVEGKLSWGHCLHILNAAGEHIGTVKEVILTFLPKFEFYIGSGYAGRLTKELSFLRPRYHLECNGWQISGNMLEWNYEIQDPAGFSVAVISKELFHWTDTYVIDVARPENALLALMVVLAIDAEKCSRDSS